MLWNRIDNPQKLHVSDPRGEGRPTDIKRKEQQFITTPWFIVQAQVSVIQHCEEPPGSCQAWVKQFFANTVLLMVRSNLLRCQMGGFAI